MNVEKKKPALPINDDEVQDDEDLGVFEDDEEYSDDVSYTDNEITGQQSTT